MSERRYSEDEVREIFGRATEEQQQLAVRPSSPTEGLTLEELQDIGRDVGIAPELVASAARSLEVAAPAPRRTVLGLPIRVGHTVQLPRRLTDAEWAQLVVDLRSTFDARGKLSDDGAFKQWTNSHLEVLLEPTPTGQQLRIRSYKESAMGLLVGGGILLTIALVALVAAVVTGDLTIARLPGFLTLFGVGAGLTGTAVLQVPAWARLRQSQFEQIGERALSLAATDPEKLPRAD